MLLVTGDKDNYLRTQWLDLTTLENTGTARWASFVTAEYTHEYATMVSLSPYETFEVNILFY